MNSKVTGIIVVGVLAASLGGMLLILEKTGGNDSSSSAAQSSSTEVINKKESKKTQIVDRSVEQVTSVKVENKFDTFEMVRNTTGKTTWLIDALDGVAASLTDENSLADCAATLKSFDTVEENAEDLSKYGFDEPTSKFTVTFEDGESRTFIVGDMLPGSDRYYYLHEEGSNTVYEVLTTYLQYMCQSKEDFVTKVLIAQPGQDSYPDYGTLTVKRKDQDYKVVIKNDDKDEGGAVSAQIMTEPVYGYLNISNSTEYTHGMWGLTASTAAVIKPGKDDIKKYGLDDPYATVTLKGDEYDYKLTIGDSINAVDENGNELTAIDSYYCMVEGVEGLDCIFIIKAEELPWVTKTPENILSSLMTFNYIKDVGEVKITKGDSVDDIKVTYDTEAEDVKDAQMNGKTLDVPSFKTFYEFLLTCPTSELCFDEPADSKSIMKIEVIRHDGGGDTLEFFEDTGRRYIVKLNGVPSYRIESKWADQFEKNITALEKGEKIGESY